MVGKGVTTATQRSYSPVYRARGLNDDDPDHVYDERVAEIALEMDLALEFMKDVGTFLKEKEDIQMLQDCEEQVETVLDKHCDMLDDLNKMMLVENDKADLQLQEMLELQKSLGYEVEQPLLSIEGQKLLEKERKRKKKIQGIYDIAENDAENSENSDFEEEDKKSEEDSQAVAIP